MKKISFVGSNEVIGWILVLSLACGLFSPGASWARGLPKSGKVEAVIDGDTVHLDSGERVRYLGIDTPELARDGASADCYAREAKEVNSSLVLYKRVSLQYERGETRDAHGRLLAYVFLPNGHCINAELLRGGLGYFYRTSEGFSRQKEFLGYQQDAIRNRRGMWSLCSVKPALFYVGNRRSFVVHRSDCGFGKAMSQRNLVRFQTRLEALEEGFHPCRFCKP